MGAEQIEPSPRILIVDDEPRVLRSLESALKSKYEIATALDAVLAREILESESEFEVIISDERMPQIPGSEFLNWAREYYPRSMRILLTSTEINTESMKASIKSAEIYRCLSKPWDIRQLKEVLDQAVEESRNMDTLFGATSQPDPEYIKCAMAVVDMDEKYHRMYKKLSTNIDQLSRTRFFYSVEELRVYLDRGAEFGVICLDFSGDSSRIEAVDTILDFRKSCPDSSIIVTAYPSSIAALLAIDSGSPNLMFVIKPISFDRLGVIVSRALQEFAKTRRQVLK